MTDANNNEETKSNKSAFAARVKLTSCSSIGDADDLLQEPNEDNVNDNNNNNRLTTSSMAAGSELNKFKLGWNLPTNDLSKSGQLDTISVDSYWVDEKQIEDIAAEKAKDPCNPNYKAVYEKMINANATADPASQSDAKSS